jgi:hypothetical protein
MRQLATKTNAMRAVSACGALASMVNRRTANVCTPAVAPSADKHNDAPTIDH